MQVSVALFCGYALAKLKFRGRGLLFACVLLALCVPIQVPALPIYLALSKLHSHPLPAGSVVRKRG